MTPRIEREAIEEAGHATLEAFVLLRGHGPS